MYSYKIFLVFALSIVSDLFCLLYGMQYFVMKIVPFSDIFVLISFFFFFFFFFFLINQ